MWTSTVFLWGIGLAILGATMLALVLWLRNRDIKIAWFDWLIGPTTAKHIRSQAFGLTD